MVLEALAESCDVEIRSNMSTVQRVSVDTGPRPLPNLLRSLLRNHSYVLQYSEDRADARWLWILAPSGDSETNAAWSAGSRDSPLDEIVLALADTDPETRLEAVLSLGDLGSREVAPFLNQSLDDASEDVREAARAVLEDIGMSQAWPATPAEPAAD